MLNTKTINKTIQRFFTSESLLDVALQCEKFLDRLNLYVYPNWFDGQLVYGPEIKRYFVVIALKYPHEKMPDPRGLKILQKVGVKWQVVKETERVPVDIKSPNDYRPGTKKPKLVEKQVWIVRLDIPRKFIDETNINDLANYDDQIDVDEIEDANDSGINVDVIGRG